MRILLLFLIAILSFPTVIAQRVFAPNEEGKMVEIKEGSKIKSILFNKASYPRKMNNIVTCPLRIYVYSEDDIETDELFLDQILVLKQGEVFYRNGIYKKMHKKFMDANLKKIAPNIYEISADVEVFVASDKDAIAEAKRNGNALAAGDKFIIGYEPNKKHKKEGKQSKYWYSNISQLPYDSDEIGNWTKETAIESVNNLVQGKQDNNQLFASLIPQQNSSQNIKYVVVQNTQPIIDNQASSNPIINPVENSFESDVDINVPYRETRNDSTFALIIANEDYNKVANVPFAKRDGQKVSEYFNKSLGLEKGHITLLENATMNDIRYELNRLSRISESYNGKCSFIIYYCGHGIPDEKNGQGYLLPVDGYGNDVSTAYSLKDLYSYLGNLKAKRTLLFTDACFSGASKDGNMLVAARGIAIKSQGENAYGNLIAFSACQNDETAYSYDEKGHGMFTYYFLKKLQETGGKVSLKELEEYIVDNVGKTAIIINGKPQTPSVSISPILQEDINALTLFD